MESIACPLEAFSTANQSETAAGGLSSPLRMSVLDDGGFGSRGALYAIGFTARKAGVAPPYSGRIFALRLFLPQVFLLLWLVLLGVASYATTSPSDPTFVDIKQLTVGPSCVMPPPPPPVGEEAMEKCPAGNPPQPKGPQISPADYTSLLALEARNSDDYGTTPARFHFQFQATTRAATCKEAAAAGTVAGVPRCSYKENPECTVHFFVGELFLMLSPSWLRAYSFGMLEADTTLVNITLVDGWDACLPEPKHGSTARALAGMHPLDALVAHMFAQAQRPDSGYLAREVWPSIGESFASLGPDNTTSLAVLNLKDTAAGPKEYVRSGTIGWLALLFVSAIVALTGFGYTIFRTWERRQSGAWTQWVRVFFPPEEVHSLGLERVTRQRCALVARHLRYGVKKYLPMAPGSQELDYSRMHTAVTKYICDDFLVRKTHLFCAMVY